MGFDRLLSEARRLTRAEAGTVYLRDGDVLRFAAVQNAALACRLGEDETERRLQRSPLLLREPSIASYVALARGVVNVPDVYDLPADRPYRLDRRMDLRLDYRTCSMLAVPLRDSRGTVFGVLQLINALDDLGKVVPFEPGPAALVVATLVPAAPSIR